MKLTVYLTHTIDYVAYIEAHNDLDAVQQINKMRMDDFRDNGRHQSIKVIRKKANNEPGRQLEEIHDRLDLYTPYLNP